MMCQSDGQTELTSERSEEAATSHHSLAPLPAEQPTSSSVLQEDIQLDAAGCGGAAAAADDDAHLGMIATSQQIPDQGVCVCVWSMVDYVYISSRSRVYVSV